MPLRGELFWNVLPKHAIDPSDLLKTVKIPKIKRIKKNDAIIKKVREWTYSRKRIKIRCSKCGA